MSLLVAVEPHCWRRPVLAEAVVRGGGTVSTPEGAAALVWAEPTQAHLIGELVDANPGIGWVQLPYAGIEPVVDIVTARPAIEWYCGKGVYAREARRAGPAVRPARSLAVSAACTVERSVR